MSMQIELFKFHIVKPLAAFGLTGSFWGVNLDTVLQTWLAMSIMACTILVGRLFLGRGPNVVSLMLEESVLFFSNLSIESFGYFNYDYFAFVASLFFFVLGCNMIGMLPFLEEPTGDLHTTFSLALISFIYVQYQKIKLHGFKEFIAEFMEPFFLMLPLNIIGELAKVVSMSFRLFGNILGGAIVLQIAMGALSAYKVYFMISALCILAVYGLFRKFGNPSVHTWVNMALQGLLVCVFLIPSMQMFFGLFEAFIQAFVVSMLTVTYLSMVAPPDEGSDASEEKA
jgi:F-type H+-transporting ATPase subunit a